MITLQTIQEEIANNLLDQLDQIIESGDETELNNWLCSLNEEQIEILKEEGRSWAGRMLDYLPGYKSSRDDLLAKSQQSLGQNLKDFATNAPFVALSGLGAGKGVQATMAAARAARAATSSVAAKNATRLNAMNARRGGPVPKSNNFNARRSMATNAEVVPTPSNAAVAARGGAPPGGAITTQNRAPQLALPKPQSTALAVRPNSSVPAVRPPAGSPITRTPSRAPAAVTAALTATTVASTPRTEIPTTTRTPPNTVSTTPAATAPAAKLATPPPGSRHQQTPGVTTTQRTTVAPQRSKPPTPTTSTTTQRTTVAPQRSKPPTPTTSNKKTFGFHGGMLTGTASKGASTADTIAGALGGVRMNEETKPTMADFRMLQERIMRKSNGSF